jgi:hypothetical protein
MAEIVNLRLARKRKALHEKERAAEANRALHGRTKAERQRDKTKAEQQARHLDGHLRDPGGPGESGQDE